MCLLSCIVLMLATYNSRGYPQGQGAFTAADTWLIVTLVFILAPIVEYAVLLHATLSKVRSKR